MHLKHGFDANVYSICAGWSSLQAKLPRMHIFRSDTFDAPNIVKFSHLEKSKNPISTPPGPFLPGAVLDRGDPLTDSNLSDHPSQA